FLAAGAPPPESDGVLGAAVAVELVHSATLVHDDVLDGSPLRRGRPTVMASAGRRAATATGDLLFARAFAELVRSRSVRSVRVLSRASSELAAGELMQRGDAWRAVSVERYMERCRLKTAVLFRAACELGGIEGGVGGRAVAGMASFGERIGLAFQLLDDVLDVAGPPERTGKPQGADLLDGTVNLPLILARERDPALREVDLRSIVGAPAAADLCARIAQTGALDATRARALDLVCAAKEQLPDLPSRQRAALQLIADGVVERYS
ncbi:MAG: polyprenyl synthetase family protein, partial [Solirubrobacteraceae bacterium]